MKTAYFDCIAGASGDMLLGALVDAGLPAARLEADLRKLPMSDFRLTVRRVSKRGFRATKVEVEVRDDAPERHLAEIRQVVEASEFPDELKQTAVRIFRRICEVEAAIHDSDPESVHLHEVGGVDAIVDVCGTLAGLAALEVGRVVVSPFPLGRGFVAGAHGRIPLPAPATLALLRGFPVTGSGIDAELVTPTGAAVLTELGSSFGPPPAMTLETVGYGAGSRELEIPNVLRVMLGASTGPPGLETESLVELVTNLDDESPEIVGHLAGRLIAAGALDVALIPAQMKKGRPGVVVQVLCRPPEAARLENLLFLESSTLGVRRHEVRRDSLPRRRETVETRYGPVRVKIATLPDGGTRVMPEYEDCRSAAERTGTPLPEVYRQVSHEAAHRLAVPHRHPA